MARNQEPISVGRTWTELTDGDATKISFQIVTLEDREQDGIYIYCTEDGTAPTATYGHLFHPPYGELNRTIADLAIGLTTPVRVWARTISEENVVVLVSDDSAAPL